MRVSRRAAASVVASWLICLSTVLPSRAQESCPVTTVACCDFSVLNQAVERRVGLGFHVWPSALPERSLLVLESVRPGDLRFSFGPNWRGEPALPLDAGDAAVDALVAGAFAKRTSLAAEKAALVRLQGRSGASMHLVVWEPPRTEGEEVLPFRDGRTGRVLRREAINVTARFYVSLLRRLASEGVPVDTLEVSNEPDGIWNIRILPPDYALLLRAIRDRAAARGVRLPRLIGPGTSKVASARPYLLDPAVDVLGLLDAVSVHAWDGNGRDAIPELERLRKDLGTRLRLPLLVTEYSIGQLRPGPVPVDEDASKRGATNLSRTAGYGARLTAGVAAMLTLADTVILWEFQEQTWNASGFGIVDDKARAKPSLDQLALLGRAVSGRTRVALDRGGSLLSSSPDGRLMAVATNVRDRDVALDLPSRGLPGGLDGAACVRPDGSRSPLLPAASTRLLDFGRPAP